MTTGTKTNSEFYMEEARMIAGAVWCDEETKDKVMDPELAEAFAKRLATWMETAAMFSKNADFYRGMLEQCARLLGPSVYVSDDGSVQEDPLMLKIPELVRELKQQAADQVAESKST